ncbi:MAG TPA: carboxylesterase family protein [Holophaga sp.]|nr:carboxylesterase family protein [Holophaga sp.]
MTLRSASLTRSLPFLAGALLLSGLLACGGGGGSSPAPTPPAITSQPASLTVTAGQPATFAVTATGTAPLAYLWKKDGVSLGATAATYSLAAAQAADAGSYTVTVSNGAGSVTSQSAVLTVNPAGPGLAFTTQPADTTVTVGQTAVFTAEVSGSPTALQWQASPDGTAWTDLAGATTATCRLVAVGLADQGRRVRLKASSATGTLLSSTAVLQVLPAGQAVTGKGLVQGAAFTGGYEFLGIPYAAPPVGALRWKAPADPAPWTGLLQTQAFKPRCPQLQFTQGSTTGVPQGDEDCLYLNVWTPDVSTPSLPVLVFLHGGAHQQGGPDETAQGAQLYVGRYLASRGPAVVVTPEFRVGPLGYLVHPGLDAEGASGTSGNYGVLDQIKALTWVRDNIGRFGGDPSKVLVFGQSAGAVDTGNLLLAPAASGLFQRAALLSGMPSLGAYADVRASGVAWAATFTSASTDAAKIAELRTLPWQTLVSTETNALAGGIVNQAWQPALDGVVFPLGPDAAFASGAFNKVPVIIGTTADEMSLSAPATVTPAQVDAFINLTIPAAFRAQARALYPSGTTDAEARAAYVQILTDGQFTAPVRRAARAIGAWPASPVWRHFFSHTQSGAYASLGAYHGIDLFYVFNTLEDTQYARLGLVTAADNLVEGAMLKYWVAFAATGVPQAPGLPAWPSQQGGQDAYLAFGDVLDATQVGVRTAKCDFWDALR